MGPCVVLLVEAAQKGARSVELPHACAASHSLRVRTNRSAMPFDWGRWRAMSTCTNSASSARRARACAVKWLPRSEIRKCRSGGRRVSNVAQTICAVTFGPASKRGRPRHWRVQLSVRTSTAIQRRAPGRACRAGPDAAAARGHRPGVVAREPPVARPVACATPRRRPARWRRSGALRRAAHRSSHTRSSCRRCARWALCAARRTISWLWTRRCRSRLAISASGASPSPSQDALVTLGDSACAALPLSSACHSAPFLCNMVLPKTGYAKTPGLCCRPSNGALWT